MNSSLYCEDKKAYNMPCLDYGLIVKIISFKFFFLFSTQYSKLHLSGSAAIVIISIVLGMANGY